MNPVRDRLVKLVVEILGVDETKVTDDAELATQLGADSIDVIEIVIEVEDRFDVKIEDDDATAIVTFGDLVRHVEQLLAPA